MNKEQTITGIIRGTGACVPKRVLDNNEIAGFVDTSDEWIRERTGVKRRRIVESETTFPWRVRPGRQALEEAGVLPEEVEMILVATGSADRVFPCTACQVQEALGASGQLDLISTQHAVDFFLLIIQPRLISQPEYIGRSWL